MKSKELAETARKGGEELVKKTPKQLRQEKGLTQSEVASALGMTDFTYSRKENGQRKWFIPEARVLASFYGVPMESISFFDRNLTDSASSDGSPAA